ncbi:hypothetical protein [Streptomyces mirabilis]|uniref:hypothetical protein n=1 Tax=Streptomyces mirabilis TaxID=68239 RepID=UPI0022554FE9|nr:hypothetical protein [Streptomyces mirabilis]MCX4428164.1 hypothetical protein [Streptomyces mirabilis]
MTPLRRLSDVEAAFARTHALMHGTTQVTTHVTVRGDLDPAHFRSGAERWAAELPLLSLRIEERPDGLWFTTGPGPRPGQIRHDPPGTPESADDVLRGELNDVLETGGPLWRLRLVRDPGARASRLYSTRNHAMRRVDVPSPRAAGRPRYGSSCRGPIPCRSRRTGRGTSGPRTSSRWRSPGRRAWPSSPGAESGG